MSEKKGMPHYSEEVKEQARQAYQEGISITEVSRQYGISRYAIQSWCGLRRERWSFAIYHLWEDDPLVKQGSENRQIGIQDGLSCVSKYPEYEKAQAVEYALDEDWNAADVRAHVSSGLMKKLTELSVPLTIEPPKADAAPRTGIAGQTEFDMGAHKLVVHSVNFEVAGTGMKYDVYPKSGTLSDDPMYGERLLVIDDKGQVLGTLIGFGMGGSPEADVDGNAYLALERSGDPMPEYPAYITFVLVSEEAFTEAQAATDSPMKAYRYIADHVKQENTAMMRLNVQTADK